ncbi:MAG TPA: uroporphyrinogen-III synthase [Roseiarcus sp.]|nr:uroporphyrinogen-III synthase [Roseiarcus sp.]
MKDRKPALRVALFRAGGDGARSGMKLRRLGFSVDCLPVVEIAPVRVKPARERYDAIVATSAKAFIGQTTLEAAAPFYAVGARTARAAEAHGWRLAAPPAPDAAQLIETLRRELPPTASVLYLAGRDRKPALEDALDGFCALEVVEAYAAEARDSWRPAEIRALSSCSAALHYSRRSAALAARLAENSGQAEHFLALRHICLSDDVAEPLRTIGARSVVVAERADEAALFAALSEAAAVFPSDGASRI